MNNELYRKLTSITLMTIMFAGGMTIAIPGELPTAVAQTNTLSVSASAAGVFGGAQVIEIVIDDPDLDEIGAEANAAVPDVEIDGTEVKMIQATTGKWYAYVASAAFSDSNLGERDGTSDNYTPLTGFLSGAPDMRTVPAQILPIADVWPFVQTFVLDGDVEITANRGDEVVTLDYDDHSDIATISVDRNDVPKGGQVHITISDFQLNLDPTTGDTWTLNAADKTATYDTAADASDTDDNTTSLTFDPEGTSGELATSGQDMNAIEYSGDADIVTIDETGSNTGVFESSDGDDLSEISVNEEASDGDTFTIEYADVSQQIIVNEFSPTLALITDGAWSAGQTVTVRLSSEDLNLNTLVDDDMTPGSDDLPVVTFGSPITPSDVDVVMPDEKFGDSMSINPNTHVITLTTTSEMTNLTVTLGNHLALLQNSNLRHYTNYLSDFDTTSNAQFVDNENGTTAVDLKNGISRIEIASGENVDGIFNLTLTATAAMMRDAEFVVAEVEGIQTAVAAAQTAFDDTDPAPTAQSVKSAAADADSDAPTGFQTAIDAIDDNVDTATATTALAAVMAAANEHISPITATIVADIFTIDGVQNNAIYRALLEETSSDSGVFEGTIEYAMLNQKNVVQDETYEGATSVDDELAIILNGHPDADTPEVTYGGDHVRPDALTHTGEVSFDAATYNVADDVTVILVDPDLNIDADGIDIYTVDATVGDKTELLSLTISDSCTIGEFETLSMRETADNSGTFEGIFEVPNTCNGTTTGEDISATYYDFRDSSGSENEWGDSATIGADTGSVSFDRTVYPVPAAADASKGIETTEVVVYVSIDDADFDVSSDSVNSIEMELVTIEIDGILIYTLGGIDETSTDSGIFEDSVKIGTTMTEILTKEQLAKDPDRKSRDVPVEQGSIITVTYEDPTDASGNMNSVSDSATFDLRNAVLQSDKSTYVIGQDALLTLIEPDLNLDSASQETIDLDRIEWDSDADTVNLDEPEFGAVPANLRETDLNTGIFQVVITIPEEINDNNLERGEDITLTYTDWGPSGADSVGDDDRAVELSIETSNFGATLELDQNIYTWTDKVFITVVATDYNFDSNVIDEIGDEGDGEITVRIRSNDIEEYNLAETGPDTGVFTGELTLVGTEYEAGDNINVSERTTGGDGPTDGIIEADNGDGLSVSFEYSDSESPLVASALIRWNVGEVQWLEASYAATGSGIVRVIDPDANLNPDAVDNLDVVAYSETFLGGITLTVTETQEASGIFEGTVEFDPDEASQGHRLQVTEGDIVTAEYDDFTLPDNDDLTITATTLIGSIVPPLERAPASNPSIVDAFDNALASVSVDQQVQITADLTSGQDRDQDFAYLVQIQNEDGVTIALSWITGTLGAGATFSPSQSWTPSETGSYTATIFVWESVSNPTALSPQLSITIDVV